MTFAIRAVWIISPYDSIPLFERRFNSVESRARKLANYVPLPESSAVFVESLLVETGIKKSDRFVLSRDGCSRACWAPAFEVPIKSGALGPLVVLQHYGGLLLCALPLAKWDAGYPLRSFHEVAQTLDCLTMLSESLSAGVIAQKSEVHTHAAELVTAVLPFGHPTSLNASLGTRIVSAGSKEASLDKTKQPLWNAAATPKGKTQIAFHISEQVHCALDSHECTLVCGTLWASVSEVAAVNSEVSITISHPATRLCSLTLAPTAQTLVQSNEATTLSFCVTSNCKTAVCHYASSCELPPVNATLDFQDHEGMTTLQLEVQSTRTAFQCLEVTLGPAEFRDALPRVSVGTAVVEGRSLRWELPPSKLKSRNAQLQVRVPSSEETRNCQAQVYFKVAEQTWSGCKVVAQTVFVTPPAKMKISYSADTSAGHYTIRQTSRPIHPV